MPTVDAKDPLAGISGLMPRHQRAREASAAEALAKMATALPDEIPPPPEVADLLSAMRPVDAATSDLRRRIIAAKPGRLRLRMIGSASPA